MTKFDFQHQFSTSKIIRFFLIFFFIEEYDFRSKFFYFLQLVTTPILKIQSFHLTTVDF